MLVDVCTGLLSSWIWAWPFHRRGLHCLHWAVLSSWPYPCYWAVLSLLGRNPRHEPPLSS